MDEQPVCPHCGGTGWKTVEREGVSAVERCDCALSERVRRLEQKANIPPLYRNASFDNFTRYGDNPIADPLLSDALRTAKSYVREFLPGVTTRGLLFIGDPGTGKTHLAAAVLGELISRYGCEGVFFDYQQLLDKIRSGYDPHSGSSAREAYQAVLDCQVLLLDDLGAHRVSDWVEDTITSIITHRCNQKKPLIATTNLRDESVDGAMPSSPGAQVVRGPYLSERLGARARSRLFEMCRIVSTRGAPDYRKRRQG